MQEVVQRIFDKWYENLPFTLNMVWTPVPVILLFNTTQSFSQKKKRIVLQKMFLRTKVNVYLTKTFSFVQLFKLLLFFFF